MGDVLRFPERRKVGVPQTAQGPESYPIDRRSESIEFNRAKALAMESYLAGLPAEPPNTPPEMNVVLRRGFVGSISDRDLFWRTNNSEERDWKNNATYYRRLLAELRKRKFLA